MKRAKKLIKKLNEISFDSRLIDKEKKYFHEKYINEEFEAIKKAAQKEIKDSVVSTYECGCPASFEDLMKHYNEELGDKYDI